MKGRIEEDELVARIARAIPSMPGTSRTARRGGTQLRMGIGDDAAILSPGGRSDWVLSCDAFLEGVHFLAALHPPDSVGFKSLARATSDLAAMSATPRFFLLTLAIPSLRAGDWLDQYLKGMARAARSLGVRLLGGDTTRSSQISIGITVMGEVHRGRALLRSGAKPGDIIYVSGTLGRAALAWRWLSSNSSGQPKGKSGGKLTSRNLLADRSLQRFLQPHLYPEIKVDLGEWLAKNRLATAAMDLSDGLSTDLARLCAASGVGAKIFATSVPLPEPPKNRKLAKLQFDPMELALHGGEDYELLFTVSRTRATLLRHAPGFRSLVPIGEITRGNSIFIVDRDGNSSPLKRGGWDPFRKK